MRIKKSKFFKAFGFGSLAVMMAVAGTFAFAPLGASPSTLANADVSDTINTVAGNGIEYAPSPLGLDPENDPVIYTTESGLEIKFGGATTALGGGNETTEFATSLPSGKPLSGYPYFTMGTYNGYAVNWVIIGKSTTGIPTTSTTGMSDYNYEKLSTWQGKTSESPTYQHFFEQTYEATTPAGAAIKNSGTLNNYAARKIDYMFNPSILSSIVSHEEISSGCVLALSECCLGTSTTYYDYRSSALRTYIQNLYKTNLNLTDKQKTMIVEQTALSTWTHQSNHPTYSDFMFALTHYTSHTFPISRYLTENTDSLKLACQIGSNVGVRYWLATSASSNADTNYQCCCIEANGHESWGDGTGYTTYTNSLGVRPACVIKFG